MHLGKQGIVVDERQKCDLELLLNGGFAPLSGFLSEDDYESVLERMRLRSGVIWPIPIVLDVPVYNDNYTVGDEVALVDEENTPLAFMKIESKWRPDKEREAKLIYGTTDRAHWGVKYLFEETGDIYLGGPIRGLKLPARHDFRELRWTPAKLKQHFRENGIERVVAFQTRNPVHRAHFELMRRAAEEHDAHLLLHPVVGQTKAGDIDYITRVRIYKRIHEAHMRTFATLSLLPLAMRMAGPREALWHTLIRKNYGATHFIVGRDHAGPGKNADDEPFYGPYDAQELVKEYADEIGVTPVPSQEVVYVEDERCYKPRNEIAPHQKTANISGTELRERLREGGEIPEWFSFPETIDELRKGIEKERRRGYAIFFTGLSGAGKSTIANVLVARLRELQDRDITLLDGDVVRRHLSKGLGFSKEDRDTNIERIGFVASEIAKHGGIAVCSAIAPYSAARKRARELAEQNGSAFVEVHVATPLSECRKRDPKGLYKKVDAGEITHFTGVDDPYEEPEEPEVSLDTTRRSARECAEEIIMALKKLSPDDF